MTYNPAIPQASDQPSLSQGQMLINFGQLNTIFDSNHYTFNYATVADRGKHKYASFMNQAAGPVTGATECALYAKLSAAHSNLFWRRESNGTEIQMSSNINPTWGVVGTTGKGMSFLPGGLLIQWGYKLVPSLSSTNTGFVTAFSASPYSIQVSMERTATSSAQQVYIIEGSVGPGSFNIYHTASAAHYVYWMAIGPA